jgi:uncharacterized protein YaiI (UPF0178 family)
VKILIDADSCPRPAREILLRSAERKGIKTVFVANRPIPGIAGENAGMELCPPGEGSADNRIVELAEPGDLVLTRDIPLAERLVEQGVRVLDDRGRTYSKENIRQFRSLRDFMVGLAENSLGTERTANYGKREIKAFADSFDRELRKLHGV